jgi:hypothetical protein
MPIFKNTIGNAVKKRHWYKTRPINKGTNLLWVQGQ